MRAACLFLLSALCANAAWLRIASPNFELYTNAGERQGRLVLEQCEQVRMVFLQANGVKDDPLPVRLYLFASEGDYRPFRLSQFTRGYYQSGPEKDMIAILASGADTPRIASHEYVHIVLHHSSAQLPRWFEEGTAEFYSTLDVDDDRALIGRPISQHLEVLERMAWLDAGRLAAFGREADDRTGLFYAQSWALVHMLNLSAHWRQGLPQFAALLAAGTPAEEAFGKAFGRGLPAAISDLRDYIDGRNLPSIETAVKPVGSVSLRINPVKEPEADLARAELLIAIGKADEAEKIYQKLIREGRQTIENATGLGLLALARNDYAAARSHLQKAIDMGASDGRTFFEYAMLLRETGADRGEVTHWLRRTVEASPNFAEAHALLANAAQREGRLTEAIDHLKRAASILPRQSQFWHALALAYHQAGERELARSSARRALDAAATDAEREAAQAAIALAGSPASVAMPNTRPAVTTPERWQNRKGDARLEGQLVEVECLGTSARFHLVASGSKIVLDVLRPGEIPIGNSTGERQELSCGRQQPVPVVVDFIAATREVVAVAFR